MLSAVTPSQREIANYSRDMLEQLKVMAVRHQLERLVELLEAAEVEAIRLSGDGRSSRFSRK
jgi:hypothetical protein